MCDRMINGKDNRTEDKKYVVFVLALNQIFFHNFSSCFFFY